MGSWGSVLLVVPGVRRFAGLGCRRFENGRNNSRRPRTLDRTCTEQNANSKRLRNVKKQLTHVFFFAGEGGRLTKLISGENPAFWGENPAFFGGKPAFFGEKPAFFGGKTRVLQRKTGILRENTV